MGRLFIDDTEQVTFRQSSLGNPTAHTGTPDALRLTDCLHDRLFIQGESMFPEEDELCFRVGRQPDRLSHALSLSPEALGGQAPTKQQ